MQTNEEIQYSWTVEGSKLLSLKCRLRSQTKLEYCKLKKCYKLKIIFHSTELLFLLYTQNAEQVLGDVKYETLLTAIIWLHVSKYW
jgi:hypothetical protein